MDNSKSETTKNTSMENGFNIDMGNPMQMEELLLQTFQRRLNRASMLYTSLTGRPFFSHNDPALDIFYLFVVAQILAKEEAQNDLLEKLSSEVENGIKKASQQQIEILEKQFAMMETQQRSYAKGFFWMISISIGISSLALCLVFWKSFF